MLTNLEGHNFLSGSYSGYNLERWADFYQCNRTPNRTSTGLDNSHFGQMPRSDMKIYVVASLEQTTPIVELFKMGVLCGDRTNTLFISTYKEVVGRNRSLSCLSRSARNGQISGRPPSHLSPPRSRRGRRQFVVGTYPQHPSSSASFLSTPLLSILLHNSISVLTG